MDKEQWVQIEIQQITVQHKKELFSHEHGPTLEQVAQRGYGVSILEGIQHGLE